MDFGHVIVSQYRDGEFGESKCQYTEVPYNISAILINWTKLATSLPVSHIHIKLRHEHIVMYILKSHPHHLPACLCLLTITTFTPRPSFPCTKSIISSTFTSMIMRNKSFPFTLVLFFFAFLVCGHVSGRRIPSNGYHMHLVLERLNRELSPPSWNMFSTAGVPSPSSDDGDEIDPRYGVSKRKVPAGPNPLHN